ncbi:MAG TPA: adenylosuccinate synthetase, partial [Methanocella sp.]|nr:adenylosuccinate synthetase [Methanocella sp.]
KIVAHIAYPEHPSIIARGGVGPNAGHTVYKDGVKYGVRMVPSGFVYDRARLLIGAGVLVDPVVLEREVQLLGCGDRLGVDYRCSVIEERHIEEDKTTERLAKKIGTTGTGCGPANKERVMRSARQAKEIGSLKKYLADVAQECNDALDRGENIIIEGSQGFGISLYYGTYPFVTSKDTSASSLAADVGVGPTRIDEVVVVFKAFPTRVGEGPFETEMTPEEAGKRGIMEFGTVTGRARRIGYWDPKMARYSAMINGATQAAITGLDRIDPQVKGATEYGQLTKQVKAFVKRAEKDAGVPFTLLSTGPDQKDIIDLRNHKK